MFGKSVLIWMMLQPSLDSHGIIHMPGQSGWSISNCQMDLHTRIGLLTTEVCHTPCGICNTTRIAQGPSLATLPTNAESTNHHKYPLSIQSSHHTQAFTAAWGYQGFYNDQQVANKNPAFVSEVCSTVSPIPLAQPNP